MALVLERFNRSPTGTMWLVWLPRVTWEPIPYVYSYEAGFIINGLGPCAAARGPERLMRATERANMLQ